MRGSKGAKTPPPRALRLALAAATGKGRQVSVVRHEGILQAVRGIHPGFRNIKQAAIDRSRRIYCALAPP